MPTGTPHDALFKDVFSQVDHAREQLRCVLPRELVESADWSTLRLEDGQYVDSELAGSQSDLLYSVWVAGAQVLIYVLYEHQSTVDALMPLRLLRYMMRIWDRWLAAQSEQSKRLPAIVPVVLSHAEGGWREATSMHALFDPGVVSAAGAHLPGFRFVVDDLAVQSEEELRQRALTALALLGLLLLRNARSSPDLATRMEQWARLWQQVWNAPDGRRAVLPLLRYVTLAGGAMRKQDLDGFAKKVFGPSSSEVIMTLSEQWFADGKLEGEAKAKAEAVLAVLQARGLPVPDAVRDLVLGCRELLALDKLLARAVTCSSPEELLG